jgi:hypothetical protein
MLLKHIFIAAPYSSMIDIIRQIGEKSISHLIFNNTQLHKIVKIYPYSDDIQKMTVNTHYNFINGFPKPFYDFFNKYYVNIENTKIYSISLTQEQLDDVIRINELFNTENDVDLMKKIANETLAKYANGLNYIK